MMLSHISQSQKNSCCVFHVYETTKVFKLIETEIIMVVTMD